MFSHFRSSLFDNSDVTRRYPGVTPLKASVTVFTVRVKDGRRDFLGESSPSHTRLTVTTRLSLNRHTRLYLAGLVLAAVAGHLADRQIPLHDLVSSCCHRQDEGNTRRNATVCS